MDNREAVNWLIDISADIGKAEHSDLWHYEQALTEIKDMLESAQPDVPDTNVGDTISRRFEEIVVRYPPVDLCNYQEYKGKPYYSIKYIEDGECFVGFGTYNLKVLSKYLRDYFMPSVQPEERTDKRTETHARDTIYRQAAIDAAALSAAEWDGMYVQDINGRIRKALEQLPPAQPEEAIPVSWIESRIERFMTMDNAFGGLTANIMLVMLNEWKREQEDDNETGRIHGSGI